MGRITAVFGQHDPNALRQFKDVASRATVSALMSDGHFGYVMPVGGVAGYPNKVSVVGVGFDIACGNAAIKTDMRIEQFSDGMLTVESIKANPYSAQQNPRLNELANVIANTISFGIGRKNEADDAPTDEPLFLDTAWYAVPNIGAYRDDLRDKARRQLGTIGSGNHYVDVFVDTNGFMWVGVHFGSRGFGHTIASNFNAIAQGGTWGDKAKEVEVLLDLGTPSGQDYWALMELAGKYAYAGREWVARKVVQLMGAKEIDLVHNHHNFAWKENHRVPIGNVKVERHELPVERTLAQIIAGAPEPPPEIMEIVTSADYEEAELVVVRKGATPAFPGQRGFVGGSMGDDSVILRGMDPVCPATAPGLFGAAARAKHDEVKGLQQSALYSTVHGAGRVMSRTQAAGKRDRKSGQLKRNKAGEIINAGMISPQMQAKWLREKGVILRGGGQDEAPQAYRRLTNVLSTQGPTIEVLETLSPLIVCMAGANEFDPYKD